MGVVQLQADGGRCIGAGAGHHRPLQLGVEAGQRHHGLIEHTGQGELAIGQAQRGLATGLVGVDLQIGAAPAWPADAAGLGRRCRSDGQALDTGLQVPAARLVHRAVPAGVERTDRALGLQLAQQRAQPGADRQALGQRGQQGQIKPVGGELAAVQRRQPGVAAGIALGGCGRAGRRRHRAAPLQGQLAGRPHRAIGQGEAQTLQGQVHAVATALGHQAAAQIGQAHRCQATRQLHRHTAQHRVQGQGLRRASIKVQPATQRSAALLQVNRQADMAAQLRHIGAWQMDMQRTLPAAPVAGARQQGTTRLGRDDKALAPIGRRCRVQAQLVAPAAVAQHQLHVGQGQCWRLVLAVQPAQGAATHHDLMLLEQPVGIPCTGQGRAIDAQGQAADKPAALGIAAHVQPRVLDQQLGEAQAQRQHGRHRQRRLHPRQAQRFLAGGVAQHHVTQLKHGQPAAVQGGQVADLHRVPECLAGQRLGAWAPFVQTGQNQPMQDEPAHQGQCPACQQHPQCDAPGPPPEPLPKRAKPTVGRWVRRR